MPRRIARYARKLVVLDRYARVAQILVGVGLPAILTLAMKPALEAFSKGQGWTVYATIATAVIVFQVTLGVLFAILPSNPATAAQELVELDEENDDLRAEVQAIESQRDRASAGLSSMALALTVLQELRALPIEQRSLEGDLGRLLFPFIDAREEVFGFEERDLFNFAVYWMDASTSTLMAQWRASSTRLQTEGKGRNWKVGEGHVGVSFGQERLLATDDLTRSGLFRMDKGTDRDQYRSAVSIPFFREGTPVGVFVVTGNRPKMFTEEVDGNTVVSGDFEPTFDNIGCLLTIYATSFSTSDC